MEEVDQIILNSLFNVGCDFADGMESLKQMTTENVVEGAVKCLKVINPDFKMSHLFPPGMSARFRVGSSLATACQNAGYRGDVGYQTFLYSSESDIRKIFMFLVEKLPRKEGIKEDSVGSSTVLQKRIGQVLREQCKHLWLPPYCTKTKRAARTPFRTARLGIPDDKSKDPTDVPFVHMQVPADVLIPSVLEMNTHQQVNSYLASNKGGGQKKKPASKESYQWKHRSEVADKPPVLASFEEVIQWATGGRSQSKQSRFAHAQQLQFTQDAPTRTRPSLPKKPENLKQKVLAKKSGQGEGEAERSQERSDAAEPEQDARSEEEAVAETEEERFQREEEELEKIIAQSESDQIKFQEELKTTETSIKQMQIEVQELESAVAEAEKRVDVQEKTCFLLPNAEENIEKLEKLIEKNSQRILTLGKMWEERRVPLINELRELKRKTDETSQNDTEMKLEELKLIRRRIKEASEETKRKEQIIKQLTSELDSMKRDVSRQSYTKRILEIVSSIHKQQEEIERVIGDTRAVQKQMNKMKGRIDRTFTAIDEAMFKDAKRDENIRQAYKYLVSLHDGCADLIRTVDDTGAIMREIRDLEEQIELELKKKSEENLTKIMKDFKEMKAENAGLIKKLKNQ